MKNYGLDEGVQRCLQPGDRPPTPEHIRRYRTMREPGIRVKHVGAPRDDHVDADVYYGQIMARKDSAAVALDLSKPPLQAYIEARAEEVCKG